MKIELEKPYLIIGDKKSEMLTTAGVASEILKFSDARKKLQIGNYLEEHIKIISKCFGVPVEEIQEKVALGVVIHKYFDCLEYVARFINEVATGGNYNDKESDEGAVMV